MNQTDEQKSPQADVLQRYSPKLTGYFIRYLKKRFFPKTFHAVRLMGRANVPDGKERPVVAFMNHSSWWDPITGLVLNDELFPDCAAFAPMDAEMLKKYAFMARIGLFPVERDSARGAAGFVRTARALLAEPGRVLGLTPQGEFVDARARPVEFKPGIAHLARNWPDAVFLPIAMEQVFWNEKKPELLVNVGKPSDPRDNPGKSTDEWNEVLQTALENAMDVLAEAAIARDPAAFETILLAETGTSPVYDLWRRLKAKVSGRQFSASHGEENQ
ncbi:MAG: lysophospholipid acyltransferase family protein [Hyphomicrobiales bacterium]